MKIVKKLNKKRYRYDLWLDSLDGLWFFDAYAWDWRVLARSGYNAGFDNDETVETKGWPEGPFRRVLKGFRP